MPHPRAARHQPAVPPTPEVQPLAPRSAEPALAEALKGLPEAAEALKGLAAKMDASLGEGEAKKGPGWLRSIFGLGGAPAAAPVSSGAARPSTKASLASSFDSTVLPPKEGGPCLLYTSPSPRD